MSAQVDDQVESLFIEPDSQVGVFLRQVLLYVDASFEHTCDLFDQCRGGFLTGHHRPELGKESTMLRMHALALSLDQQVFTSFQETEQVVQDGLQSTVVAHLVRYLNCVQHAEYQLGLDALHAYFAYAPRQALSASTPSLLQFGALALAALHASFGHMELAWMGKRDWFR